MKCNFGKSLISLTQFLGGEYATSGYTGSNDIQQQSELPVMHAPIRRKKKKPSDGQKIRNGARRFNLEAAEQLDRREGEQEKPHFDLR